MKVYAVIEDGCENGCRHLCGVFSTYEKAKESLPYFRLEEEAIEETDVDPPMTGEKHKKVQYFTLTADGGTTAYWQWSSAGDVPLRFAFIGPEQTPMVIAIADTLEEAEKTAREGILKVHPVWQVGRYRGHNNGGFAKVHHPHPSCVHPWHRLEDAKPFAVHEDESEAERILKEYETTGTVLPGLVLPEPANAT